MLHFVCVLVLVFWDLVICFVWLIWIGGLGYFGFGFVEFGVSL